MNVFVIEFSFLKKSITKSKPFCYKKKEGLEPCPLFQLKTKLIILQR